MSATAGRLRLLCVGAGRDGTLSLAQMIGELFEREGAGRRVAHEYESRALFEAAVVALEGGEQEGRDRAAALIRDCPFDAIVGAGYAHWLPLFAQLCGPGLVLVHLRREDRAAAIRSLTENASYFPTAYGCYSEAPEAVSRRPAAFHYGEMGQAAWRALPLADKLAWYFDKTHALVAQACGLFAERHELSTEALNSQAALQAIGRFTLGPNAIAKPVHLNRHAAMAGLDPDRRHRMQWLMGRFDLRQAADDDLYPLAYFANAFVAWTGYQVRRSEHIGPEDHRTRAELDATLNQADALLARTRELVGLLKGELEAAQDASASEPARGEAAAAPEPPAISPATSDPAPPR